MPTLRDLKVGDKVTRYLSSARIPMVLVITRVTDYMIECGGPEGWTFDRDLGYEIDFALGWGVPKEVGGKIEIYTGSTIEPYESEDS